MKITESKQERSAKVPRPTRSPAPTPATLPRATPSSTGLDPARVLQLQRTFGNRHVVGLLQAARDEREVGSDVARPQVTAPGLTLGAPRDACEQEADRMAAAVSREVSAPGTAAAPPGRITRRAAPSAGAPAPAEIEAGVAQARGGGERLGGAVRGAMERAFGADLGGVSLHTDARADAMTRSIQARAFTVGRDVFFRGGEYAPASPRGMGLLAHELTHVVQQGGEARAVQGSMGVIQACGFDQSVDGADDKAEFDGQTVRLGGKFKRGTPLYHGTRYQAGTERWWEKSFPRPSSDGGIFFSATLDASPKIKNAHVILKYEASGNLPMVRVPKGFYKYDKLFQTYTRHGSYQEKECEVVVPDDAIATELVISKVPTVIKEPASAPAPAQSQPSAFSAAAPPPRAAPAPSPSSAAPAQDDALGDWSSPPPQHVHPFDLAFYKTPRYDSQHFLVTDWAIYEFFKQCWGMPLDAATFRQLYLKVGGGKIADQALYDNLEAAMVT